MKKKPLILALAVLALASCGGQSASASGLSVSSQPSASGLSVSQSASGLSSQQSSKQEFAFKYWNDCEALTKLKNFVTSSVTKGSEGYIAKEDRLAVFDMDGTLYGELYPTYLEYVMYQYRVLEDPTYKDKATDDQKTLAEEIKNGIMYDAEGKPVQTAGNSFPSGTDMRHARLAAQVYAGMTLKEFDDYVKAFLAKEVPVFTNLTYASAFYLPMKEVVTYLHENDYNVYVVSGSDRLICRPLVCDYLNIAPDHIIGMDVKFKATEQGDTEGVNYTFKTTDTVYRTEELIIKNLKFNKVAQICQEIGQQPVLSFGNSGGDSAMHNFTISNNPNPSAAFMLVADDVERDYAVLSKSAPLPQQWKDAGYNVISMKNDFKTIYGENVLKKPVVA